LIKRKLQTRLRPTLELHAVPHQGVASVECERQRYLSLLELQPRLDVIHLGQNCHSIGAATFKERIADNAVPIVESGLGQLELWRAQVTKDAAQNLVKKFLFEGNHPRAPTFPASSPPLPSFSPHWA